jgi:hypothetical protein
VVVQEENDKQALFYMRKAEDALNGADRRLDGLDKDRDLREAEAWIDLAALAKGVALPQRATRAADDVRSQMGS